PRETWRELPPRPLRWVGLLPLLAWEHHKHHRRACGLAGFVFAPARRTSVSFGLQERQTESQSVLQMRQEKVSTWVSSFEAPFPGVAPYLERLSSIASGQRLP